MINTLRLSKSVFTSKICWMHTSSIVKKITILNDKAKETDDNIYTFEHKNTNEVEKIENIKKCEFIMDNEEKYNDGMDLKIMCAFGTFFYCSVFAYAFGL